MLTKLALQIFPLHTSIQRLALLRTVQEVTMDSLAHCIHVVLTYAEVSLNSLRVLITHTPKGLVHVFTRATGIKTTKDSAQVKWFELNAVFILFPY